MAAGSIIIDLLLNSGSFETDTNRAAKSLQKAFKDATDTVKELAAAFGVGIGVDAFKDLIAGSIEAAAHLDDLSKKTGIAADVLGGIGFAAKQAGGDLEGAVAGANKLNKSLAEAAAGTPQAAEAFKVLGVNVKDAQGNVKTADVALADLADKFEQYADGPNKTALAIRLFGKAGADMIPLLDEGGAKLRENIEFFKQYSGVTNETAKAANEFEQTLEHLHLINQAFGQQLAASFLPTLQTVADAFLDMKKNSDLMSEAAEGLGTLFNGVAEAAAGFAFVIYQTARGIGALAASVAMMGESQASMSDGFTLNADEAVKAGEAFGKAGEPIKEFADDFEHASDKMADFLAKLRNGGKEAQSVNALLHSNEGYGSTGRKKPDAPGLAATGTPAPNDFDALMKQVTGIDAVAKATIQAGDANTTLTKSQELGIKIQDLFAAGLITLTNAQIDALAAGLKLGDAHEREADATKKALAQNAAYFDQLQDQREEFEKQAKAVKDLADQYGLTQTQLDGLAVSRQRDIAAALRQQAVAEDAKGNSGFSAVLKDQAAFADQTADAMQALIGKQHDATEGFAKFFNQYNDDAENANKTAREFAQSAVGSLEDSLTAFLSTGKGGFHALVDSIIAEINRLYIVKPLLASVFGSTGSNGIGGGLISDIGNVLKFGGSSSNSSALNYTNALDQQSDAAAGVSIISKFASLFSGRFADGGYVPPGQWGIAGENGPEPIFGGRTGKTVVPAGAGGPTQHLHIYVTPPSGTNRDTALQQGQAIGQGIQRALARNS